MTATGISLMHAGPNRGGSQARIDHTARPVAGRLLGLRAAPLGLGALRPTGPVCAHATTLHMCAALV